MAIIALIAGAYIADCVLLVLRRAAATGACPSTLRGRAQLVAPGALLVVLALMTGVLFHPQVPVVVVLMAAAGIVTVWRPAAARKLLPFALIGLGLYGLVQLRSMGKILVGISYCRPGAFSYYGLANIGGCFQNVRLGVGTGLHVNFVDSSFLNAHIVVLQMWAFLVAGGWLAWHEFAGSRSSLARRILWVERDGERAGGSPRWGLLLLPVLILLWELVSMTKVVDRYIALPLLAAIAGLAVLVVISIAPALTAGLAVAGVIGLGVYGVAAAVLTHPPYTSFPWTRPIYGLVWVTDEVTKMLAGAEGLALLAAGVWLAPRVLDSRTRALLWRTPDAVLAERVQQLTVTRADAVDTAAAELRRVERDLHDGAQARLVALGMSLRAAERLITSSPQAALELIAEARESSSRALTELRDLVRGIYPPVLADRGLGDAVRALALDTPLSTAVDSDLPGRLDAPVESACYFAVAEALTNAVRHAGASRVEISIRHAQGVLRLEVTDNGAGGADPADGSGLRGLERRLAAFDGILAVSSPPGGPTMIVIEVPCALSSPKVPSGEGQLSPPAGRPGPTRN